MRPLCFGYVGVRAGEQEHVVGFVRHGGEHLLAVDHPLVTIARPPASAPPRRRSRHRARCSRGSQRIAGEHPRHDRAAAADRSHGARASPPRSKRCPCCRPARPALYSSCMSAVISTGCDLGRRPPSASRQRGSRGPRSPCAIRRRASCPSVRSLDDVVGEVLVEEVRAPRIGGLLTPDRAGGRVPCAHCPRDVARSRAVAASGHRAQLPCLGPPARTAARRTRA